MFNANKIHIDIALVQKLIATQFPQWADLPIVPVKYGGWDNRTFHLGKQMTVRLPSSAEYAPQVEKEQHWLPKLALLLPLPIPIPLAMGKPTEEFPFPWSIYQWIEGETASINNITDLSLFATSLAQFLIILQCIDTTNGPINFYRETLKIYDAEMQQAITILDDKIDTNVIKAIWSKALASTWHKAPVWMHGDVAPTNLLVKNGQLSAVIDFGGLGIGDPACDLAIAWTFFKGESRDIFRATLKLDNDTWERGCGWALWKALIICAQLPGTNPLEIEKSKHIIDEIVTDYKHKMS